MKDDPLYRPMYEPGTLRSSLPTVVQFIGPGLPETMSGLCVIISSEADMKYITQMLEYAFEAGKEARTKELRICFGLERKW